MAQLVVPNTKDRLWTRWGALKSERASWDPHWKLLSQNLLPRSGRFFTEDRNRGDRRHNQIYDNTGTRALRVLGAGLMAGMTSPARPWFRLAVPDVEMMKYEPVKLWLADVTQIMRDIFARSNLYRSLHQVYEELGVFGTAPLLVLPDFENVIHTHALTAGEYAIGVNHKGQVDTLYREFQKPVGALVGEFGYEACSHTVRQLYDQRQLDTWVTVVHAIEPRHERDAGKGDAKNMPWRSVYFEQEGLKTKYLRESGFNRFPALGPRWSVSGQDIYGNSPGMEALGDIQQLQHEQLRKAQGIDYMTKPPLQMPTSRKNTEVNTLPGGISYVDSAGPDGGIRTAFEVRLDLNHLLLDIQDVRSRVQGAFYADLFLMLAQADNRRMTATEVAERHEEKLLMLGPVLERLHNELLDPLIELTFDRMVEADILPPAPPELEGLPIRVEFVSMLAQAQKAVATNSIDRFVAAMGVVSQFKPAVLDKFDEDDWADEYADLVGINPQLINSDEDVAQVRQARAEAEQQQAALAAAQVGADAMGKLGGVVMPDGRNAGGAVAETLAQQYGGG